MHIEAWQPRWGLGHLGSVAGSTRSLRTVAGLLLLVSIVALAGWLTATGVLIQPFRTFPPLRVGSALGLMVLGLGLLSSTFGWGRPAAVACALLAMFYGTAPLQQALGLHGIWDVLGSVPSPPSVDWNGEAPGQLALSSAILAFLGGLGLLAMLVPQQGDVASITLSLCGGMMLLLSLTVALAQVLGFLEGVHYGPLLGSSLQSVTCGFLVAVCFGARAWARPSEFAPPPAWLPISVGAGALLTVILLWRTLVLSEESQLSERTRLAARATRSALLRQIKVGGQALQRMAEHSRAPDTTWVGAVTQIVRDVEGVEAIVWTDSAGVVRGSDAMLTGTMQSQITTTLRMHGAEIMSEVRAPLYYMLAGDSARALMAVPRCDERGCTDIFSAVLSAPQLMASVLADTVLGFQMAIGNGAEWYRQSMPVSRRERDAVRSEPIFESGLPWQISLWPSPRVRHLVPSRVSDLVLLLGLAVAVLLALALRLAQSVSQSARIEERAKLDLALQSPTDGIWEWDLQTGAVTRSAQLWSRLGLGANAADTGMDAWIARVHPDDRAELERRIADHLAGRSDAFDAQYRVKSVSGRWHDFIDRGRVVLRSSDGKPLRLLGMFADVTDRRNAEEIVRQAETMSTMGRLAARIAHEINNPLAGIQNSFLLIKDAIPDDHPHVKYVGAIEREISRISHVTRQLYETYRPETEGTVHAAVQTVVGDAITFLEQVNRNTGVSIDVDLGGVAAVVRLSDSILRQCVYNLVQNAIEASPPGSTVHVSGAIEKSDFILRVRDHGPGVPPEMRERVFAPFVSTKPTQLATGGMGLGLALVRRALDAAGGSVEVLDAPGGGALFVACIPLAPDAPPGVTA